MKKVTKLFSVLLAVAMGLCSLAFAACGQEGTGPSEHEHTFAEAWSHDETNHWHAATCGHDTEKKDVSAHDQKGADGACSVCGYKPVAQHEHTFAETWTYDETNHWHAATCVHDTEKKDVAAHDQKGADGACSVCGYKPETQHEHTYRTDYWGVSATQHFHMASCEHTTEKIDVADHDTNGTDGTCSVCHYKPHEDTYKYQTSATHHWQKLVCSRNKVQDYRSCDKGLNENLPRKKNMAEHTFDDNFTCTVCGFNGKWDNYDGECIICEICGGCIKTYCVHSSEEDHKFCGDHIENAKTIEIEAEDAELSDPQGGTPSVLNYVNDGRGCVHPSYGNVKFTFNVSKACDVTLKLHCGKRGKFTERATLYVNGEEFATKSVLAQPDSDDSKCSFVWNTMGCIHLEEGENTIEFYQYNGGAEVHLDKIAMLTPSDVSITYEKIDNSALWVTEFGCWLPLVTDDAKDKTAEELQAMKFQA